MRLTLIACLGLAACGSSGGGADAEEMVDCSTVTGVDTFVAPLKKMGIGGAFEFEMLSATPAPPARNTNTWVVQINTMQSGVVGNPVDGASMVVTPYMPSHQHGTPEQVIVTPTGDPGQYKLDPGDERWVDRLRRLQVLHPELTIQLN
jgi:hypothetical protein